MFCEGMECVVWGFHLDQRGLDWLSWNNQWSEPLARSHAHTEQEQEQEREEEEEEKNRYTSSASGTRSTKRERERNLEKDVTWVQNVK